MDIKKFIKDNMGIKVRDLGDSEIELNLEDVARGLGFTKERWVSSKKENVTEVRWDRVEKYLGRKTNSEDRNGFCNKEDLKKLIQSTNRVIDRKWYEIAGLSIKEVILTKEQETIGFVADCFKFTQINLQHKVGNYKIDMYFPQFNIAIECDEFGHDDRGENYDSDRQAFIEKELGCKFIRFNPDSKTFKIQDVICEINKTIFTE